MWYTSWLLHEQASWTNLRNCFWRFLELLKENKTEKAPQKWKTSVRRTGIEPGAPTCIAVTVTRPGNFTVYTTWADDHEGRSPNTNSSPSSVFFLGRFVGNFVVSDTLSTRALCRWRLSENKSGPTQSKKSMLMCASEGFPNVSNTRHGCLSVFHLLCGPARCMLGDGFKNDIRYLTYCSTLCTVTKLVLVNTIRKLRAKTFFSWLCTHVVRTHCRKDDLLEVQWS